MTARLSKAKAEKDTRTKYTVVTKEVVRRYYEVRAESPGEAIRQYKSESVGKVRVKSYGEREEDVMVFYPKVRKKK